MWTRSLLALWLFAASGCETDAGGPESAHDGGSCSSELACDEGRRRAQASLKQGVAGVAYGTSDVAINGCSFCEFFDGAFELWRLRPGENPQRGAEILAERPADERVEVAGRYEHPLEAGSYLACTVAAKRSCLFFEVATNELWTLHLRSVFADPPLSLKLYDPDGEQVEVERFVVGDGDLAAGRPEADAADSGDAGSEVDATDGPNCLFPDLPESAPAKLVQARAEFTERCASGTGHDLYVAECDAELVMLSVQTGFSLEAYYYDVKSGALVGVSRASDVSAPPCYGQHFGAERLHCDEAVQEAFCGSDFEVGDES